MRRRQFVAGLGSAAAWPVVARAQQPAMPVIGYLSTAAPGLSTQFLDAFRRGLSETGFVEGRNVTIEYRFANGETDRLREYAADLVRRHVTVIAVQTMQGALAAKAATATIPIVFRTGGDPVQFGLVSSLNRPGGNITGINDIILDLGGKQLGLLHDVLPGASRFAVLAGPLDPESEITGLRAAASAIGQSVEVVAASTNREIDMAFASLVQKRIDALLVTNDPLFFNSRVQVVTLEAHHRLPASIRLSTRTCMVGLPRPRNR
jgi:putative tryptophan/tyrosine transport system substrate-binding protein